MHSDEQKTLVSTLENQKETHVKIAQLKKKKNAFVRSYDI